ncbi:MAG: hypothetical protein ACRECD_01150 [Burkholderiaceae bacterium]
MNYLLQVLIALDQFFNTLFGGWADETISSHLYRLKRDGKPWGFLADLVNAIFFWQHDHCRGAYEAERRRQQLEPEMRG